MLQKPLRHPRFCHALITEIPCCQGFLNSWLTNFKKAQNCSARLIFKTSKCTHVSPLLAKLHWLPVAQRIDDKISSLCYDVVSDTALLYLSDLLCLYAPSGSLRSSADTRIFRISTRKKKFQGQPAFSHLGPVTWNKHSYSVRHAQTQFPFKTQLKTTLFRSVYEPDSYNFSVYSTSHPTSPVKLHVTCTCVWASRGERERERERERECKWSSNGLIFSLLVCVFWWHVILKRWRVWEGACVRMCDVIVVCIAFVRALGCKIFNR